MLFTGYYDSFIQILGETAWWHTAPKSAQITDVSCNAVNIAPSALQVLGAVGWAVNVNWRLRWHRSACACMGRAGSASLGCVAGPLPRAPSVCRDPARVIATVPKMEAKTAKWLENKCLHMCRASTLCRHLRRVKIEPTKPPGTGPNWQVAGFDPPLGENSPAYREAMRIINRIRVTYALARAKK